MTRAKGTRSGRVTKIRKRKAPAKATNNTATRKAPTKRQPPQERIRTTEPSLSFGVEIEAVLVWHEDLGNAIEVDHDGWPDQFEVAMHLLDQRHDPNFDIANDSHDVRGTVDRESAEHNHAIWRLRNDTSVDQFELHELEPLLRQRFGPNADPSKWSQGEVEIVTAKYEDVDKFVEDLNTALDCLNTDQIFYEPNSSCGLHIHVGRTDDESMSLMALQHLLFASIIFEEAIMSMHHPNRSNNEEVQSNRLQFTRRDGKATPHQARELTYKITLSLLDVQEIRLRIYATATLKELEDLMGPSRNRRINWTHISEGHPLRTVEFRQHAGSVNPREIKHWIIFCTYLVRWAYDHAHIDTVFPRITTWGSRLIVLNKLLLELNLPEATRRRYWVGPKTRYG